MKKIVCVIFAGALFFTGLVGMSQQRHFSGVSINQQDGNSTVPERRKDGTMIYLQHELSKDPTLAARMAEEEKKLQAYIEKNRDQLLNSKVVYKIPVVVHVVYNTTAQNISDAQIKSQIDVLNEDYRKRNSDFSTVPSAFANVGADMEIEFCLASVDPQGNPTTGINRVQTSVTSFSATDNDRVKKTSQGGADAWDVTKYFNIWVCNLSGGILGYARFPSMGVNQYFGWVCLYNAFGRVGNVQAPYNKGRTSTHEMGHCFELRHIWGDDNGACTGTDYCNDTPNQADANYGCPTFPLTDACSPNSPGVMFMNFMDYVDDACMKMFTNDQKARARAAIQNYLSSLLTSNVGCSYPVQNQPPVADFTYSSAYVGGITQFTDMSSNSPTSWSWTITPSTYSFTGGTSATSQNPKVIFSAAGNYTVTLTATNSFGSSQKTKTVTVSSQPASGCDTIMASSFENQACSLAVYYADNASPFDSGFVSGMNAYGDLEKAMKYTTTSQKYISSVYVLYALKKGTTGNTSVKIYGDNGGSPGSVLGTSATISLANIDTTNYGINFTNKYQFSSPVAVNGAYYVSVVLPVPWANGTKELAIWCKQYSCSTGEAWEKWNDNTWHSFASSNSWGVQVDMAIFPVECTATNLENSAEISDAIVYPNPSTGILFVHFGSNNVRNGRIQIFNSIGALVADVEVDELSNNTKVVDISNFEKGIYTVRLSCENGIATRKVTLIK